MNICFMSLGVLYNLEESSVHLDLLKALAKDNNVWLVCKNENLPTAMSFESGVNVLRVNTGQQKKVALIKKGINTVLVGPQFKAAVKKYLPNVKFDLILYTTPPITFVSAIRFLKKRDSATTYLMLKDIFPQNAIDIGLMTKNGIRGLLWKWFRHQEILLYKYSDYIGCMSPANVIYTMTNNPYLKSENVGICPNSIIPNDMSCDEVTCRMMRDKYEIPLDRKIFVYGGNLGMPQDIPYLIECIRNQRDNEKAFFLIVGDGTEYGKLDEFFKTESPSNARLMQRLPRDDYDALVGSCDVGLVLLDHRFSIPNFPSRILSYMQAKVPVMCITDDSTDVGSIAESAGFGISCSSASVESFNQGVGRMLEADCDAMGQAGWDYLCENYDARVVARQILETVSEIRAR